MGFFGFIYFRESSIDYPTNLSHTTHLIKFDNIGYLCIDTWDAQELIGAICILPAKVIEALPSSLLQLISFHPSEEISPTDFYQILSDNSKPVSWGLYYHAENGLLAARNVFGTVPIYYSFDNSGFLAFSTEIPRLLNITKGLINTSVHRKKISQYLSLKENSIYSNETFFNEVHNVLPGFVTEFYSSKIITKKFFDSNSRNGQEIGSLEQSGDRFRKLFISSVKRSIEGASIIGSHLSGGLDSSSLVAATRHLQKESKIHTFFGDTSTTWTNENEYAKQMSNYIYSQHHEVKAGKNHLESLIKMTQWSGQPLHMINGAARHISLIKESKEYGCDVLLTGHDGDSIVGFGKEFLTNLYETGDWSALKEQLQNLAKYNHMAILYDNWYDRPVSEKEHLLFQRFFYKKLIPVLKSLSFRESLHIINIAHRYFSISPVFFLQNVAAKLIDKVLAARRMSLKIESDFLMSSLEGNNESSQHELNNSLIPKVIGTYGGNSNNGGIRVSEEYYALGQHFKIGIKHPFYDPELYLLGESTPASIKYNNGIGRGPLREAMRGLMPESIRTRTDKAIFTLYGTANALDLYHQSQDFLTPNSRVWEFVNKDKFSKVIKALQDQNLRYDSQNLMTFFCNQTISLSVWLDLVQNKNI